MANKPDSYEMLDTSPEKSPKRKFVALALAAVAIIGAGLGGYYLWERNQENGSANQSNTVARNESTAPGTATPSSQESRGAANTSNSNPTATTPNSNSTTTVSGEVLRESVHFATNSTEILPSDVGKLESFLSRIRGNKGTLTIEGYADGIGSDDYNQRLSTMRAEQIAGRLRRLGVGNQYQVTTRGFGKTQPIGDNGTEDGRAQNRRVAISFIRQK
jgi:outer membrane protein OmpA-like peptidoglycan-associated protein